MCLPNDWPIDLGDGYKAEWSGTALWIYCPKLAAKYPDAVSPGSVRIPTEAEAPHSIFWTLEQKDPITLSPSISVKGRAGDGEIEHFFIRNGKVVQA